jgi:RNA polymerase sigma-70 factor, ECF subfamily
MTGDRLRQAVDALNQAVARRVEGGRPAAFQAMLSAAARGDEDAFAALWRDLQPVLLHYLKVVAPEAAEDLAAETWLGVVRGLGAFGGDEPAFRAWVFTIARHQARHWRRHATRRAAEPLPTGTPAGRPAPDYPPSTVVDASSSRATLALIAALPPDQAEVITLQVLGGLTVAEVAEITGKRPKTVSVLARQGLRRLAARLDVAASHGTPDQQTARRVEGGRPAAFQAMLSAAARGDEDAFAALWRDLQPVLLHYLKVVAPEAAEDLAAETWLGVVRGLGAFGGDEPAFRAWVFTIARHQARHWRRHATRRAAEPLPTGTPAGRPAPDYPPSTVVDASSSRATLALIAALPPDQAEVITLRVIAGLDAAEVAEITGKRPGTVRALAHRGLRRLGEQLEAASTRSGRQAPDDP